MTNRVEKLINKTPVIKNKSKRDKELHDTVKYKTTKNL